MTILSKIGKRDNWWWPTKDVNGWEYSMKRTPRNPQLISNHVSDRKVMVQAGGNTGFYVRQFAELFDLVYTFEPDPVNFMCLCLNANLPNVIKIQSCVGNTHNLVDMNLIEEDIGATFVKNHEQGQIPTLRIDDLNLSQCDLIQLDVEGFEYFALLGAENTIGKFRPILSIEWWMPHAARYNVNENDILAFLNKYSYQQIAQYDTDRIFAPA